MALLSLRKSLSEHEQMQNLLIAALAAQRTTFGVLESCTLELDKEAAQQLRGFLSTTGAAIKQAAEPEILQSAGTGFQREWKHYYERSAVKLAAIREELSETVQVLQETIASLERGREGSTEGRMKEELSALAGAFRERRCRGAARWRAALRRNDVRVPGRSAQGALQYGHAPSG